MLTLLLQVYSELTGLELKDGVWEMIVAVNEDSHVVKSIYLSEEQIEAIGTWR